MIELMSHMIPYFPDRETSLKIAEVMLKEGTKYLEVQFAFSDPSADGPLIEAACQTALGNGFTIDEGFEFIRSLNELSPELKSGKAEIFVMTYASVIYIRGIRSFVEEAAGCGVTGLIIPDLPLDSDEGLGEIAKEFNIAFIPVLAASSREDRIKLVREKKSPYVYCALRTGITGVRTELGESNIRFIDTVAQSGAKILAGFGIRDHDQVQTLEKHAHGAIVGSAFVRAVNDALNGGGSSSDAVRAVGELVCRLKGK